MIKAPFNFVPLADKVYFPEWADQISQDMPFSDGEDGIIELEITNETPLFVRNGAGKGNTEEYSAHVDLGNGQRQYYIPGTSLKGCFRSVLEVLSFAKMIQFNDDSFGYRSFTTQMRGLPRYMDTMKGVSCGWLVKEENVYLLKECSKGIQKIRHFDILKSYFENFFPGEDHATFECKARSLGKEDLFPEITVEDGVITYKENQQEKTVPAGKYRLVTTGFMEGKKVEYLFSLEQRPPIVVPDRIIQRFETIHKYTPSFGGQNGKNGLLKGMLHNGQEIPVFFKRSPNGEVESIGITRMYKYPFTYSVKDAVMNGYSEEVKKKMYQTDLPEAIFGNGGDSALKGRVQFGHAMMQGCVNDQELIFFKSVLGQPRASYFPLYVRQDGTNNTINNYSSVNARIAGRKRYRVVNHGTLPPVEGNDNEIVKTSLLALPENQVFRCRIAVHNLRKIEIGAILSAITFNKTPGTFHNIGQAKSFGFGKIGCQIASLKGLSYSVDEYISAFNAEISYFLQTKCQSTLGQEECLKMLVSIASDTHTAQEMALMSLDEYERNKEENTFRPLTETPKVFNVLVDEQSIISQYKTNHKEKIHKEIIHYYHQCSQDSLDKAIQKCQDLILFCKINGLPFEELERLLTECEEKLGSVLETNSQIKALCNKIKILLVEANPLLDGKKNAIKKLKEAEEFCLGLPDGEPMKHEYLNQIQEKKAVLMPISTELSLSESIQKVSSPEVVFKQIQDWSGKSFDNEVQTIADKLIESFTAKKMKKRDIQGWTDASRFDIKWKKLIEIIGSDLARQVFDAVCNHYDNALL